MDKKKVLIISAPFGNGHIQVSNTLKEQFLENKVCDVEVFDIHSNHIRLLTKIVNKFYLATYNNKFLQQIYKFFYYKADVIYNKKIFGGIYYYGKKTLLKKIQKYKPDIIVNTFPISVIEDFKNLQIDIPTFTVTTDYYINRPWVNINGNMHYVTSAKVKQDLQVKYNLAEEKINITGIPIRKMFYKNLKRDKIIKKYGIPSDRKILTIFAGAHGVLPNIDKISEKFMEETDMQLVIICGTNKKSYKKLLPLYQKYKEKVKLFGYIKEISEIMCISDFLITKPGGITLAEASYMGVPVLLYRPSYGQELENAKYFEERGAGIIVTDKREVFSKVMDVMDDNEKLQNMKRNIKDISQENAAQEIVNNIYETLNNFNG